MLRFFKRTLFWLILVVITVLVNLFYFFSIEKGKKGEYHFLKVEKGSIIEEIHVVGYIKPHHSITVKSQINGIVKEIYCQEGDYVKKGDSLLKIELVYSPTEYALVYQENEENIFREKAALHNLERYKEALRKGLITKNYTDYINAEKEYNAVKSKRSLSEHKLSLLKKGRAVVGNKVVLNLITSPVDGYIIYKNINIGDPIISLNSAQTATSLFVISDMKKMIFEGVISEYDVTKVRVGMPANISISALPDLEITGKLENIMLQSEKENRKQDHFSNKISDNVFDVGFNVRITNLSFLKGFLMRSGYSATAKIVTKEAKDVLVLTLRAIYFEGTKPYVLLPNKKAQEFRRQFVQLGLSDGIKVEILSGLNEGQKVIDK